MYLRIGLRSLLAEGNIPELVQRHDVAYTIYTTPEDALILENSPTFAELRKLAKVHFSYFTNHEIDAAHFGSHGVLWQRGVDLARRNGEIVFFLIPDILYAEGTLGRWIGRFKAGCRAVYTPGPQVVLETILPEIEQRFPLLSVPHITLGDQELLDLLFRHLHPIAATMFRDSPRRIGHPEHDLRAVPGRGFVARVLCSQPFCFDPGFFFALQSFSPCDHLERLAFEPCTTISIEPLLKHVGWYYRPWSLDSTRLSQLGAWWHQFGPPGCQRESETTYEFCHTADAAWLSGRRRVILEGRFLRAQLGAATFIFKLFIELTRRELHEAARLLAVAAYIAPLRRKLALRPGSVLLIPNDDALSGPEGRKLKESLVTGDPKEVVIRLRDYVIPHKHRASANGNVDHSSTIDGWHAWLNANGLPIEEIAPDVKVLSGPLAVGDFTLYVIDRVLGRKTVPDNGPRPGALAVSEPVGAVIDSIGESPPAENWGSPTRGHALTSSMVDSMRQVAGKGSEAFAALGRRFGQRLKRMSRPLLTEARYAVRRVFLVLDPIPGVGRLGRLSARLVRYAQVHGLRATARRLSRALGIRRPRTERLGWATRKLSAAIRHVRLHGWRETARVVARRLRSVASNPALASVSAQKRSSLPVHAVECLNHVRLARGLEAAEQVLRRYEATVSGGKFASAPLELVRHALRDFEKHGGLQAAVEKGTRALIQIRPDWSEAWLELGYLMLDSDRPDEALDALSKAEKGRVYVDGTASCRDPRAQAAAARGRLLVSLGHDKDARDAYAASLSILDDQREGSAEYGMVLHRLGEHATAASQFFTAMNYGFPSWCMPRAGRDARRVTLTAIMDICERRRTSGWFSRFRRDSPSHSLRSP